MSTLQKGFGAMWAFDGDTMHVLFVIFELVRCVEWFCLALVASKAYTMRYNMRLQFLWCRKAKVTLWTFVLLACATVCIKFDHGRVAFAALVADFRLSCWPYLADFCINGSILS